MSLVAISQTVAVLVDGNNIDKSANAINTNFMVDYDKLVPKLVGNRSLNRFYYLREGRSISAKFAARLHANFYGIVKPCLKSADVPLTIEAVQLADKVDTIIIVSGDSDYIELVKYLKARGIRVEIASFIASTSNALVEEADHYHEITSVDCFVFDQKDEKKEKKKKDKPESAGENPEPMESVSQEKENDNGQAI